MRSPWCAFALLSLVGLGSCVDSGLLLVSCVVIILYGMWFDVSNLLD